MASPSIGAGAQATSSAGVISVPFTVTGSGNGVLVATTHIDPSCFVATSVTGIPGATFVKIAEGVAVEENGYPAYKGAPSLWLATGVTAGTYTVTVQFSGSTDLYGTAVVQQLGPTDASITTTVNNGNSATPATASVSVLANSTTVALVAFSPNGNIGFDAPPAGWVRQGVQNDNASFTGLVCDSNQQTSSATISETFPNAQNVVAPWSVITATFTAQSTLPGATQRRAVVAIAGGISELPLGDTLPNAPTSHAGMADLVSDDHPQYHTDTRADARYRALAHAHTTPELQQSGAFGGQALRWSGSGWVAGFQSMSGASLDARQISVQTVVGTAVTASDNLVLGMEANGVYQIECFATGRFDTTGAGMIVHLDTPDGARNMVEVTVSMTTAFVSSGRLRALFPSGFGVLNQCVVAGTTSSGTGLDHTARITGIIRNGATAGNCVVKFASSSTGVGCILQPGSTLTLWRLA